jgi:hypothetical protein
VFFGSPNYFIYLAKLYFDSSRVSLVFSHHFQIGKTNHGRTLYGRATRPIDACLCPVGALSLYLLMCFNMTHEFKDFILLDWLDNSKWLDVKLLVDPSGGQFEKPMSNGS